MSESTTIRWERDDDGVVILTLDDPNQSTNTMNAAYGESMLATVQRLEAEKEEIAGVVITSAKKTFFAGGDLNDLKAATDPDEIAAFSHDTKAVLRRLETLGKPVVAAINGAALGGGLEICLACHHRIAVDSARVQLGFPEVTLGLLPGAGGVVRSVRMLGIGDALMKLLLQGQRLAPHAALELGIIDEVVPAVDDLVPAGKKWIAAQGEDFAGQPWDQKGYKMPGGTPSTPSLAASLPVFPGNLAKQLKGANYPAPKHIMSAAVEGAQVDIDNAFEIEGRYFVDLVMGQVSKNMIQAFFFDLRRAGGSRGRPEEIEAFTPTKMVVLGAGMMGAAIAYVSAKAGVEVVLKDVSQEAADRGKSYSEKLLAKAVQRGRSSQEDADALLARITATTDPAAAEGAQIVIEAVFEDPSVKAEVMAEIEPHLAPDALLGSNTSTLPITQLAANVSRPADFIGLHFFSPVDKMPLLEIIRGEQTSDDALHRALDVAKLLRKTPIVVNDSRGFFTSRVILTFLNEGMAMLAEGIPAPTIEQASSQAGYPAPVLQLSDELNMKLIQRIRDASKNAIEAAGGTWSAHPAEVVVDEMVQRGRAGRLDAAGFYDYADGRRAGVWPGLKEAYPWVQDPTAVSLADCIERMLFIEALESVRCRDEGVIELVADANVGSILGIGFPGWTGGVLQYINGYEDGLTGFVARARELAATYGERFEPPASLVAMAERGEIYTDDQALVAAA